VALYLADHLPRLLAPTVRSAATVRLKPDSELSERETAVLDLLRERGASFFGPLHDAVGGGYPGETVDALWNLVWHGLITNDTFHALRAFTRTHAPRRRVKIRQPSVAAFRSRRLAPPSAEGRWTLLPTGAPGAADTTKWAATVTQQLLARHGIVTREAVAADEVAGGFGIVYPVLKGMEEHGRIRRGYFVAGLGATQFAMPGALDLLRSLRDAPDDPEVVVLAATDPANPYGAALKWPKKPVDHGAESSPAAIAQADAGRGPTRSVGATVILVNGALAAYLPRGDRQLVTFLPDAEPDRSRTGRALAQVLIDRARSGDPPRGMLIEEIDGAPPPGHPMTTLLTEAGFIAGAMGMQATFPRTG
jgi:ATP-dependent Lhr-like helicase